MNYFELSKSIYMILRIVKMSFPEDKLQEFIEILMKGSSY